MFQSTVDISTLKEKFTRAPIDTSDGVRFLHYSLIMIVVISLISLINALVIFISPTIAVGLSGLGCVSAVLWFMWFIFIILGAMRVRKGTSEVKVGSHEKNSLLGMIFAILVIIMLIATVIYAIAAIVSVAYTYTMKSQGSNSEMYLSSEDLKNFIDEIEKIVITILIISVIISIFMGATYYFPIRSLVKNTGMLLIAFILIIAAAVAGCVIGITVVHSVMQDIKNNMPQTNNSTELSEYFSNISVNISGVQAMGSIPNALSLIGYVIYLVLYSNARKELEDAVRKMREAERVPPPPPPPPGVEIYSPKIPSESELNKVKCPYCDFEFEIAPSLVGKEVQCPRCGAKFKA